MCVEWSLGTHWKIKGHHPSAGGIFPKLPLTPVILHETLEKANKRAVTEIGVSVRCLPLHKTMCTCTWGRGRGVRIPPGDGHQSRVREGDTPDIQALTRRLN